MHPNKDIKLVTLYHLPLPDIHNTTVQLLLTILLSILAEENPLKRSQQEFSLNISEGAVISMYCTNPICISLPPRPASMAIKEILYMSTQLKYLFLHDLTTQRYKLTLILTLKLWLTNISWPWVSHSHFLLNYIVLPVSIITFQIWNTVSTYLLMFYTLTPLCIFHLSKMSLNCFLIRSATSEFHVSKYASSMLLLQVFKPLVITKSTGNLSQCILEVHLQAKCCKHTFRLSLLLHLHRVHRSFKSWNYIFSFPSSSLKIEGIVQDSCRILLALLIGVFRYAF